MRQKEKFRVPMSRLSVSSSEAARPVYGTRLFPASATSVVLPFADAVAVAAAVSVAVARRDAPRHGTQLPQVGVHPASRHPSSCKSRYMPRPTNASRPLWPHPNTMNARPCEEASGNTPPQEERQRSSPKHRSAAVCFILPGREAGAGLPTPTNHAVQCWRQEDVGARNPLPSTPHVGMVGWSRSAS